MDLSTVYLDILKDRLYTFRKDSPLRRGSQTVLFDILVALTKLMAPVLSFTAEEIWRMLPESVRADSKADSVHLAMFPEVDPRWADTKLAERWERLLDVRMKIQSALEWRRRDKVIGSSLEAKVVIGAVEDVYKELEGADLTGLCIVSEVILNRVEAVPKEGHLLCDTAGLWIDVEKAASAKCERCWNYRAAVGSFPDHPTLCDRCVEAVR